ncbi:transposase [Sorangium sp. So ce296]
MGRRKRRAFTPEFKAEAVRLAKAGDRSIGQVAKDLDLTETAMRDWIKRADADADHGPPGALTTPEREHSELVKSPSSAAMSGEPFILVWLLTAGAPNAPNEPPTNAMKANPSSSTSFGR